MFQVKRKERGLVSLEAWVDEGALDAGEEEEKESLFSTPGSPWVPFSILSAVLNMGLLASSRPSPSYGLLKENQQV